MSNEHIFAEIYEYVTGAELPPASDNTHDHYELCFLLEGAAEYYVESSMYTLHPGDLLLAKKAESHFPRPQKDESYKLLSVRFSESAIDASNQAQVQAFLDSRPLGQFNMYPAAQFKNTHWKYYFQQLYEHRETPGVAKTYLNVLLVELMLAYSSIRQPSNLRSDQLFSIISYINSHLSEPMSVEALCQRFFVSRSHLNRLFRKMTGVSVWDYVVAKRLIHAKALLEAGESPAVACQKSGFNDYSPFYRAYRARYGVSPRLHKQKHI